MLIQIPLLFVYVGFGIIAVLAVAMFLMLLKMGSAGRFWLRHNVFKGNNPVLLVQTHTNALKHYSVVDDGRNLRWGKDRFMFMPGLTRSADDKDELNFNEINKATGHIDGKPVFLGAVSASVACNPHLLSTINAANLSGDNDKSALNELLIQFKKTLETSEEGVIKRTIRDIHLFAVWSIKDLAEIMNIVITPQRLRTVFDYGEMKGRNIVKTKETLLFIVIFALLAAVCFLAYMVTRP